MIAYIGFSDGRRRQYQPLVDGARASRMVTPALAAAGL